MPSEAVFCGTDGGHREASRDGHADGGTDPESRHQEQIFYRWKKQYVGLEIDQVRQMKQLQEENARFELLVGELSLDKTMLQAVLR